MFRTIASRSLSTSSRLLTDPLATLLTPEESAIATLARQFAQSELLPLALSSWRSETFPRSLLQSIGNVGLLGSTIQGGASKVASGLIMREIERVDSGFRSTASVQSSLVMHPIHVFGSQEQKDKYLDPLGKGELVGCFGLTEPDHGSDPSGMQTTATETEGGFTLNGSKTWITNAPIADLFVIWARCKWDNKIRGFLVEKGTPGLSTAPIKNKLALRVSITGSISLSNVFIPHSNLLPLSRGLSSAFSCLNSARYGIAWGVVGALESCIDEATTYALERKQFSKPIASFQLVQKKLVDAKTEATLGLLAAYHVGKAADDLDGGELNGDSVSLVKRNNCGKALFHARVLLDILGGNASSDEYGIGRHAQNLQVTNTYEGTQDIHTLILGKAITGIQAFT